jgi:hypothetical protein
MAYGHAERNLALIRQLEAETRKLIGSLDQLDPEHSAWLQEVTSPGWQAGGSPVPRLLAGGARRAARTPQAPENAENAPRTAGEGQASKAHGSRVRR